MLIVYGKRAQGSPLYRHVRAAGYQLEHVDDPAALASRPEGEALLVHSDDPNVGRILGALPTPVLDRTILLLERPTEAALLAASELPVGCTIASHGELSPDDVSTAVGKLVRRDVRGMGKYLAQGTEVSKLTLTESSRRGDALDVLDRFCSELGIDPRLVNQFLTAADEFITNAFYNAAVDEHGRRLFAHISRIEPVTLPVERPVEIEYASDGRKVGVAVRDYYGSFDRSDLVRHLARALHSPHINYHASGAGLGLVTAYHATSQVVFDIAGREHSDCIGLIDVVSSYRDFLARTKSFQIFHTPAVPKRPTA